MRKKALGKAKVLEFCTRISGSYCAKVMADMGAEVIKIEAPQTGDDLRRSGPFSGDDPHPEKSGRFLFLNSNKLGVTLDPRQSTGKRIFRELVKNADILVEDGPPEEMEALGLGYDELKVLNPGLVMTSITDFGRSGPYKDYKAHFLNISHVGGQGFMLPIPVRDNSRPPVMAGGSKGGYDIGITTLVAVLAAYYRKRISGRGQRVEVSRQEAMIALNRVESTNFPNYGMGVDRDERKNHPFVGGTMACKDGYVTILSPQDNQWDALVELLGNPEWAKQDFCRDGRSRMQNALQINELIEEWMKHQTREEVVKKGQALSCPVSAVNSAEDIVKSEQFEARGFFTEMEHPQAGKIKFPTAPYRFEKTPWHLDRPAPLLGEHNEEIFCRRLGYDKNELVKLREANVI
ncbi:MAG: CoA transferase [Proteobacteria bacterium]|nr:CoA transferase [Pseudomonadota bacterium]